MYDLESDPRLYNKAHGSDSMRYQVQKQKGQKTGRQGYGQTSASNGMPYPADQNAPPVAIASCLYY